MSSRRWCSTTTSTRWWRRRRAFCRRGRSGSDMHGFDVVTESDRRHGDHSQGRGQEHDRGFWEGEVATRLDHLDECLDDLIARREKMHAENLEKFVELSRQIEALMRWRAWVMGVAFGVGL